MPKDKNIKDGQAHNPGGKETFSTPDKSSRPAETERGGHSEPHSKDVSKKAIDQ